MFRLTFTFLTCIGILGCYGPNELPDIQSTPVNDSTKFDKPGPVDIIPETNLTNQQLVRNQLVIKYAENVSEDQKDILRKRYLVKKLKRCNCVDATLELWTLDMKSLNGSLEEIRGELSSHPDLEGTDFQYLFNQPSDIQYNLTPLNRQLEELVKDQNSGVTVAIIDSGLDLDFPHFERPFLFNSLGTDEFCIENGMEEISGWDFVSEDNIPEDLHGHGTFVTELIRRTLVENYGIDFQILPVKSFDKNGKGTYFDILCGFRFASLKPEVGIINMSFGWYNRTFELLPQFISEVEERILLICSSGNNAANTDEFKHYPSGYEYPHILSVGGINEPEEELAPFSNYGPESVDVAAKSENIVLDYGTTSVIINGTSFANAYASANAAALYDPSYIPADEILLIVNNSVIKAGLIPRTKFGVFVNP